VNNRKENHTYSCHETAVADLTLDAGWLSCEGKVKCSGERAVDDR
jgi:hypothetical protein